MNTLNLALRTANSFMSWSQEGEEYLQPDALGFRSKLGARRSSNVAESLQDGGFDFLQLLAGVAILHVGNCNAEAVGVVVQVKLL